MSEAEPAAKKKKLLADKSRRVARGVDPVYDQFPTYDEKLINQTVAAANRIDHVRKLNKEFPPHYFKAGEHNLVKPEVSHISI